MKKDKLSILIPSMRPSKVVFVVEDLLAQSRRPDRIIVVDNSDNINPNRNPFSSKFVTVLKFGENIGTNAVWNMMWDQDTEFVGFMSDDLRLDLNLCDKLIKVLKIDHHFKIAATCPSIKHIFPLPYSHPKDLSFSITRAKGNAAAAILRLELLRNIPRIPNCYRVFFGDNWMGYWFSERGYKWVILRNCYIHHEAWVNVQTGLAKRLEYKKLIKEERGHWKDFVRKYVGRKRKISDRCSDLQKA